MPNVKMKTQNNFNKENWTIETSIDSKVGNESIRSRQDGKLWRQKTIVGRKWGRS